MKLLDIAIKDMLRSFRSSLAIGMMFIVPLLITGLIYAAFGGMLSGGDSGEVSLPVIPLQVVNLDEGDSQSGINAGQMLVEILSGEELQKIFAITESSDSAAARAAVDRQEAAVALILPSNFSQAALSGEQQAEIELYQDPTLAFGPSLVREVVEQFLDGFSGGRIAAGVLADSFAANNQALDPATVQQAQMAYGEWLQAQAGENGWNLPANVRRPNQPQVEAASGDQRTSFMGPVMVAMMIFFVFFGGTVTAQLIIREQEEGTLARLFTTPTPLTVILGGKFLTIFLMIIVQSIVLINASALLFGIQWGNLLSIALAVAGLVVASAGFGVFLMSLVKSTRQAGPVTGGVLSFMGMVGGLMTGGMQAPGFLDTMSLVVPQGWAMRSFRLVLAGAGPQDVLLPVAVLVAFGLVFFVIGTRLFSKRFA